MKERLIGAGIIAFFVGIGLIATANGQPSGSDEAVAYWILGLVGVVGGPISAVSGIAIAISDGAGRKR